MVLLDGFKQGLDKCIEDRAVNGYLPRWLQVTGQFRGSLPCEDRLQRERVGDFDLCALSPEVADWLLWDTGLDGPLVLPSRALLKFLLKSSNLMFLSSQKVGYNQQKGPSLQLPTGRLCRHLFRGSPLKIFFVSFTFLQRRK